jgi:glycosyltransferase involved in cell wall biosynthesis
MKIIRIASNHPSYLESFYRKNPELAALPYAEQKSKLDYNAFGWADFWSHSLRPLGYSGEEFVVNFEVGQKAWAKENNVAFDQNNWILPIARAQILKSKPDILFFNDYVTFPAAWLRDIKRDCPSIRILVGWCGAPFLDESVFSEYDLILTCVPELRDRFKKMGKPVEILAHAFDPRVLERIDLQSEPKIDFSFIGQILRTRDFHKEREEILEFLVDTTPIQIYSPVKNQSPLARIKTWTWGTIWQGFSQLKDLGMPENVLIGIPLIGKATKWKEKPVLPLSKKLAPHIHEGVFGLDMFQKLRDSKVTFNNHIGISTHSASNMRLFEATGVGTCLLTDWKPNISDFFVPEKEVVTYKTKEECTERLKWLLSHPNERAEIAHRGQKRTLKEHTFENRALRLHDFFQSAIPSTVRRFH